MALALRTTTAFERDLKRVSKQGKDLDKLEAIVDLLQAQGQLVARLSDPRLRRVLEPAARLLQLPMTPARLLAALKRG